MKWTLDKPCATCPYRREVEPGTWHRSEFINLREQNQNEFGGAVFQCHSTRVKPDAERQPCVGWLLDQKRMNTPSIQLRLMLCMNESAAKLYRNINDDGLYLYDSVDEMCEANEVDE